MENQASIVRKASNAWKFIRSVIWWYEALDARWQSHLHFMQMEIACAMETLFRWYKLFRNIQWMVGIPNVGCIHAKLVKPFGLFCCKFGQHQWGLFCHHFNGFLLRVLEIYPSHCIRICMTILSIGMPVGLYVSFVIT